MMELNPFDFESMTKEKLVAVARAYLQGAVSNCNSSGMTCSFCHGLGTISPEKAIVRRSLIEQWNAPVNEEEYVDQCIAWSKEK